MTELNTVKQLFKNLVFTINTQIHSLCIRNNTMSNSRQHLCVSLRWLAGRTSIKSINYPPSIPARETWGILLPSAVYPSAVPLVPCTKEREQPMGRICKGQEIHGLQEATSKYWSYQQAIA